MEYVRFGASNLKVSRLALGAMGFGSKDWREWVIGEADSRAVVERGLEHGINFFDTCDFYSIGESERMLGAALRACAPRQDVVIATKVGNPMTKHANARGFSRKHVFDAIDASLERLQTDYVDLYQTHIWDPSTNLAELVDAFGDVVRSGRARYIGVTTLPAWTLAKLQHISANAGGPPFVSMQCEYNLCHREAERELMPLCRADGVALIPFSPLARGFLSADRRHAGNESPRTKSDDYTHKHYHRHGDFDVYEAVAKVAEGRGVSPSQIALAWVLRQPGITAPIFGPTRPAHVDETVAALDIALEDAEVDMLEAAYQPRPPRGAGH